MSDGVVHPFGVDKPPAVGYRPGAMALAYDGQRAGSPASPSASPKPPAGQRAGRSGQGPNTISASQARAARRREALSNEQAISAWLRELSGRRR